MSAQNDRIARAAAHIDANEVAPGVWQYYADETHSLWHVSARELAELCDYLDSDDPDTRRDAYSLWCQTCATAQEVRS